MLGVIDYGIGGLGIWQALQKKNPSWPMLYLAHNQGVPFGQLNSLQIRKTLESVAPFFLDRGVCEVFVACNAASSVIAAEAEVLEGVRYVSLVPFVRQALQAFRNLQIGIIGGQRTIDSQLYEMDLRAQGIACWSVATQPLSAWVEDGIIAGEEIENYLRDVLPTTLEPVALLLACTHYPVLTPVLQKLKPDWQVIDPAATVAQNFIWHDAPLKMDACGKTQFWTTGNLEKTAKAAKQAFGVDVMWHSLYPSP